MTIADEKQAVRKAAMAARKQAHMAAAGAGDAAASHLLGWLETLPDMGVPDLPVPDLPVIAGYMPIHTELDILPAMQALHARGFRVAVPVIMAKAQPLRFREWHPDAPMQRGAFGAMVPEGGAWLRPDLLLCPMLAFDATGQRMGYGGGFYDRTLAALAPVRAMGFAYAAQQVASLPHEPTDMPLDGVITENGIIWPQRG